MSKYKLGRLYLDNFKSFKKPVFFDFRTKDLLLLDGPNGYGKTTVFDALEICFQGKITRFTQLDSKIKNQHPLKNDNNRETTICLELQCEDELSSIVVYVSIDSDPPNECRKKGTYSKRILLTSFPEIDDFNNFFKSKESLYKYENKEVLDLDVFLEEELGYKNLQTTFSLFNYIQQEESTYFLKTKEQGRHSLISHLFGTEDQQKELVVIQKHLEALCSTLEDKNSEKDKLKEELEGLQVLNDSELELIQSSQKIYKIKSLKIEPDSLSIIALYRESLNKIKELIPNLGDYKRHINNKALDKVINNKPLLKNFIYVGIYEKFSELESLQEKLNTEITEKKKIEFFKDIVKKPAEEIIDLGEETINRYLQYFPEFRDEFRDDIAKIPLLKASMQSHESLLNRILSAQENLRKVYEQYHNDQREGNIPCPFCGIEKESLRGLFEEYDIQYESFKNLLGQSAEALREVNQKLKDQLLTPIYQKIIESIAIYDVKPSFIEVLQNRNINEDHWNLVQELKRDLDHRGIDYRTNLLATDINDDELEDVSQKIELLQNLLGSKKKAITNLLEFDEIENSFQLLGVKYGVIDKSPKLMIGTDSIDISDIVTDLNYLSFLEVRINNAVLQEKISKYSDLNEEIVKLKHLEGKIESVKKAYLAQIKIYERDIASKITIPFYIYSSKILQTRLEGNGIFLVSAIGDGNNVNNYIRFAASAKDDHDAWNTMSSGQLSGIVITFMLAMNKVFPSYFKTLMIDDPVQNMDEINMVSLLQLLRYEFADYQLIMSTHDKNISNYFKYKYDVIGRNVEAINVREHRYNSHIVDSFN